MLIGPTMMDVIYSSTTALSSINQFPHPLNKLLIVIVSIRQVHSQDQEAGALLGIITFYLPKQSKYD